MKAVTGGKLCFPDEIAEGTVLINGSRIERILRKEEEIPEEAEIIDAAGLFVGPGLIDEHMHGYHQYGEGFDITDQAAEAARAHLKHGVTSVVPSPSYSLRLSGYLSVISQCRDEIRRSRRIEAGEEDGIPSPIAGIHLEGPYINPHYGAGRKYAWKYSDEVFEKLFLAGGEDILQCTYAPEMPHALQVEAMIRKYGVIPAIGHTAADPESMERAVRNGAAIITHLFCATANYQGMHAFDRTGDAQDGVSQVALGIPGLYYELICDRTGCHVTRFSQRLALRCAGEDHLILVSDCTYHKRADLCPEDYPHLSGGPEPDPDAADWFSRTGTPDVNLSKEGNLFGSRITVAQGAASFMRATGADVRTAFRCASENPARALGLSDRGKIAPGRLADLVFTDASFTVKKVIFRGKVLPEVRN